MLNSPVSQRFSPSDEQSEQHIHVVAHKLLQPTAGCRAIFNKYCCYTKRGGIIKNLTLKNYWGYITDVSQYHNAGIWSMDQNIWRFMLNKANLRDLIAATGLVILLKFNSNRWYFSPCDLDIWWMTLKNSTIFRAVWPWNLMDDLEKQ